jgi:hypothetical protein
LDISAVSKLLSADRRTDRQTDRQTERDCVANGRATLNLFAANAQKTSAKHLPNTTYQFTLLSCFDTSVMQYLKMIIF